MCVYLGVKCHHYNWCLGNLYMEERMAETPQYDEQMNSILKAQSTLYSTMLE